MDTEALKLLVAMLSAYEPDLEDNLADRFTPWHTVAHKIDLPPACDGPLGRFTVTVPDGTIEIAKSAFADCTSCTRSSG